jgi:DNA-binding phage protein
MVRESKKISNKYAQAKNKRILRLRKDAKVKECNPTKELLDEGLISRAIWECLKDGDPDGVSEVLEIYFYAVNKTRIAKEASIARSTVYSLKGGNPTIKTLAKLVHACT